MNTLTKIEIVLHFAFWDAEGGARFRSEDRCFGIRIGTDAYEDMGRPTVITVTGQPGDLLNGV